MKKFYLSLFILILSINHNYAQDWLKIANDGYKEYEKENYCLAFEYLDKVKQSDEKDAKIAIKIWGDKKYDELLKISNNLCFFEKRSDFDKSLIEYSLSKKPNDKYEHIKQNLKNILKNSNISQYDVEFYKDIINRINAKHKQKNSNVSNNNKSINNENTINSSSSYKNKFYYSLFINIVLGALLLFLFYKWIVKKYSIL